MRKRLLLAAGTMAGLVCMVLLVLAMLPGRPEVSLTTLSRLTVGMSEADVADVFGPPAAGLTGQTPLGGWIYPGQGKGVAIATPPKGGLRVLRYSGPRATVTVEFGVDGRLVRCYPVIHEVSGLERLRLRLNWW